MTDLQNQLTTLEAEVVALRRERDALRANLAARELPPTAHSLAGRYEALFDAASDGILLFSSELRVIDCNPEAARLLQRTQVEVIGQLANVLLPEVDLLRLMVSCRLADEYTPSFDWSPPTPNDTLFETEVDLAVVYIGKERCCAALIRDVTARTQARRALAETEARFQALARFAPVLMKMSDERNHYYFFSQQWLDFTGNRTQSECEDKWTAHLHPDDAAAALTEISEAFRHRRRYEVTYRLRHCDGLYRWVIDAGEPYHNDLNQFKGYISCAIDITDRRRAEEEDRRRLAAHALQQKLETALNRSGLVGITVRRDGKVQFCNQSFLDATGWTEMGVKERAWFELVATESVTPQAQRAFQGFFDGDDFLSNFRVSVRTAEGTLRAVQFSASVLNQADDSPAITLIGEDVTDQLQTAEALRESNRQLQDLFDNANDLVQVMSLDGNLLFVNRAWCNTLGYAPDEVPNLNFVEMIHPTHRDLTKKYLYHLLTDGGSQKFETTLVAKDGKPVVLNASFNCEYENNRPVALRGFLYDITDRARAERSERMYYRVASLAATSVSLDVLYDNIRREVGQTIRSRNFYIALLEEGGLRFVYYLDEYDEREEAQAVRRLGDGLTEYVIRRGEPVLLQGNDFNLLTATGEVTIYGRRPLAWLGVPLRVDERITGAIAVQSYHDARAFTERDLELLSFVSGQVALTIRRKQTEQALSRQSGRLRAIFESGSHLIWSVDRQLRLTTFNQNFSKVIDHYVGTKPIEGLSVMDVVADTSTERQQKWRTHFEEALKGNAQHFEIGTQLSTNRRRWYEVFLNAIRDENQQVTEISGIALDVTLKKRSETALRESEAKFRAIFLSFQDIYFRTSPTGIIEMVTPSVYEVAGYTPAEVEGKSIADFFIYKVKGKRSLRQLWRQGSIRNFEVTVVTKSAGVIEMSCNIRLLRHEGRLVGVEGVARDITELKRATDEAVKAKELAEKSLRIKEQFLANMSHEIRTPMNGIIGVVDLMADTALNETQQDYVDTVRQSSETLLAILNDILDISKIEAGKMQLRETNFGVRALLDSLISLFQQRADEKGLSLSYHLDDSVPPYLRADETRLSQVLSNLISNAIKFTETGQVRVHLRLLHRRQRQCTLKVEVIDTGVGIPPDRQDDLFNTFSQLDDSQSKTQPGTGLGLVISRQLIRLMHGDIGVDSAPGQGSTFWFTFRTTEVAADEVTPPRYGAASPTRTFDHQPDVLLVDDNAVNRKVAGAMLSKFGCVVTVATDGLDAIERVQAQRFDLILMDIQMPRMDGVTAARELRKLRGDALPPVVAMTAYSMRGDEERFLREGFQDYISKPIKPEKLFTHLDRWLGAQTTPPQKPVPAPPPPPPAADPPSSRPDLAKLPVLEIRVAEQLSGMIGPELTKESYEEFIAEAAELLDSAQAATGEDEILSTLHTLKGNASTLGVARLAAHTRYVEETIKTGRSATLDVPTEIEQLLSLLGEFRNNFTNLINL